MNKYRTMPEVAKLLKLSIPTVHYWIEKGVSIMWKRRRKHRPAIYLRAIDIIKLKKKLDREKKKAFALKYQEERERKERTRVRKKEFRLTKNKVTRALFNSKKIVMFCQGLAKREVDISERGSEAHRKYSLILDKADECIEVLEKLIRKYKNKQEIDNG